MLQGEQIQLFFAKLQQMSRINQMESYVYVRVLFNKRMDFLNRGEVMIFPCADLFKDNYCLTIFLVATI